MDETCPHCGNDSGFAFGTCRRCGFNTISNRFDWIKVFAEDLSDDDRWMVREHAKRTARMCDMSGFHIARQSSPSTDAEQEQSHG